MENQDQQNKTLQDILLDRGSNGGFGDKRIRRSRDYKFYGITMARTGSADLALAFKIIRSSGEQLVIPYHDLISPFRFDGKSTIELSTSSLHITIMGTGLDNILDYIAEHRLMWIKEPVDSEDSFYSSKDEDEIIIDEVKVEMVH